MANGTIAFDTLSTSGQISGTAVSVDTDYLAYGSAKQWCHYAGAGTPTIADSFNVASLTDNSTGAHFQNAANNFANDDFSVTAMARDENKLTCIVEYGTTLPRTTSTVFTQCFDIAGNGAAEDADGRSVVVHGDLA